MRRKGSPEELERRRRRAVELLKQGETPATLSRIFGVSRQSVYRWKHAAEEFGPVRGLASHAHNAGRPRQLSPDDHRRLEFLLLAGATAHGWSDDLWTAPRVQKLVLRHFGVHYHVEHIRRILTERLHWSCQRPQQRARERNEKEIRRWKREEFPRIKKGLSNGTRI